MFWLFGALSMTVVVAFGFVAFGLIFAGMMCVLPGVVAHPPEETEQLAITQKMSRRHRAKEVDPSMAPVHLPLNPKFH